MNSDSLIPAGECREYRVESSAVFWTTRGPLGGLSNMARGYPLVVNGMTIPSVEAMYQALRFPFEPELQAEVISMGSAWLAKQRARFLDADSRPDWERVRVRIMRWCLRMKLGHHPERFGEILLSTGEAPIVERSSRDIFWGAKPQGQAVLIGINVLGRLLMELREELKRDGTSKFRILDAPDVPNCRLFGETIGIIECIVQEDPAAGEVPWVISSSQGV